MTVSADLKASQQKVEVGIRQGERVQIVSGVKPGDRVVTAGAFALPDGTQVKLIEDAAEEKPAAGKDDDKAGSDGH
jgi:multidrug efflux pump subunit AcrA (membrane-fusion protein)